MEQTKEQVKEQKALTPDQQKIAELEQRVAKAEQTVAVLAIEVVLALAKQLQAPAPKKQRLGSNHAAKRVLDKKTGITYDALSKAGAALAEEFGVEKSNFAWYAVYAKDAERFEILG